MRCEDREKTGGDRERNEGIVAIGLEGKGRDQSETDDRCANAGQQGEGRRVADEVIQAPGSIQSGRWRRRHGLIPGAPSRKARLAGANPPPRKRVDFPASSSLSQRRVSMSSTSYHSGSKVAASPISA